MIKIFFKIIWVILAVAVLCKTLIAHHAVQSPEVTLSGLITMAVISAPSGFLAVLLLNFTISIIISLFSIVIPDSQITIIASWLIIFASGYFQWFILIPRLLDWYNRNKSNGGGSH